VIWAQWLIAGAAVVGLVVLVLLGWRLWRTLKTFASVLARGSSTLAEATTTLNEATAALESSTRGDA
jgi:hypothetical protein